MTFIAGRMQIFHCLVFQVTFQDMFTGGPDKTCHWRLLI